MEAKIAQIIAEVEQAAKSAIYKGFKVPDLQAAFSAVQNKTNWKYPIEAVIPVGELEKTIVAIEFYAGCETTVHAVGYPGGKVKIKAVGYYAAVGA